MAYTLAILPGQIANYPFIAVEGGAFLDGFTVWAALVTLDGTQLAVVHDGVGIIRTTTADETPGFLVTFTAEQTSLISYGTQLKLSMLQEGLAPLQVDIPLRILKTAIPSAHL